MKEKKRDIALYQTNMDNLTEVGGKNKNVTIKFYNIKTQDKNEQRSLFERSIKNIFEEERDLSIDPYQKGETLVIPSFSADRVDENHVFVLYGNMKSLDENAKMFKGNVEIKDPQNYKFKYFLFSMIDLEKNNLVTISSKNVPYWIESFTRFFSKFGVDAIILPYKDMNAVGRLKKSKVKSISCSFVTNTQSTKNTTFASLQRADYVEKTDVTFKIRTDLQSQKKFQKEFVRLYEDKTQFSKFQAETEDGLIDLIQNEMTMSTTVQIPNEYLFDSVQMDKIKKTLFKCLEYMRSNSS